MSKQDMVESESYKIALMYGRIYSKLHFGNDWEDTLQEGIIKLLRSNIDWQDANGSDVMRMCIVRGIIDAARKWYGDSRRKKDNRSWRSIGTDMRWWIAGTAKSDTLSTAIDLPKILDTYPAKVQKVLKDWMEGYSHKEIAQRASLTEGRISQILTRYAPAWRGYHTFARHSLPTTDKQREARSKTGRRSAIWTKGRRRSSRTEMEYL